MFSKTASFPSLLLLLVWIACSLPAPEKINEDKKLFELGMQLFEKKRYSDAAPYFEQIKNRFPESPFLIESELKLADANFKSREFATAQVDYESFRTLHPTHEKIPYVYLQIAKCQLEQAPGSVQKDQAETELAVETLGQLTARWPESEYAKEGLELLDKANEKLARKKMYVANFYIGQKKYVPALKRLESLNNSQTPEGLRREAAFKLGYVHYKMNNMDIAKIAFERVIQENRNDPFTDRAKKFLSRIEQKDE